MTAPALSVRQAITFAWRRTWPNFGRLLLVAIIGLVIYSLLGVIISFLELLPVGDVGPAAELDPTSMLDDPAEFLLDPAAYRTNPVTYLTPRNGINLVVTVLYVVVSLYLFLGVTRIGISVTAGAKVTVSPLFSTRGFGRYLGGTAIHLLLVVVAVGVPVGIGVAISALTDQAVWAAIGSGIGWILLFVITMGFVFFGYVILDRDSRVVTGIRQSHELVRPHLLRLLGLCGLLTLVMVVLLTPAWLLATSTNMIGFLIALPLGAALAIGFFELSIASAYRQLSGQSIR